MLIANPFARHLTFTSGRTRTRRDHEKYLTLIDTIALLHQYQREPITHLVKSEAGLASREVAMLPVTLDDIETAIDLADQVEKIISGYVDRNLAAMEERLSRPQRPAPNSQGATE